MARSLPDVPGMPVLPDDMFWRLDFNNGVYTLLAMSPRRFGPPKREAEVTVTGDFLSVFRDGDRLLLHAAQAILRQLLEKHHRKVRSQGLAEYEGDHR